MCSCAQYAITPPPPSPPLQLLSYATPSQPLADEDAEFDQDFFDG